MTAPTDEALAAMVHELSERTMEAANVATILDPAPGGDDITVEAEAAAQLGEVLATLTRLERWAKAKAKVQELNQQGGQQ